MQPQDIIKHVQDFADSLSDIKIRPLPLGEIEFQLRDAILNHPQGIEALVQFAFGSAYPTDFRSYRGDYASLGLGFSGDRPKRAGELLGDIEAAYTQEFKGWKGGMYRMYPESAVYIAMHGNMSNTRITGIEAKEYHIEILTAEIEN
jgi:hypothetical protein